MPPEMPSYKGVYNRLFLPPVLILGIGRWGAEVCQRFFEEVESVFKLDRSLRDCFATAAILRDPDVSRVPLEWAQSTLRWPTDVEDTSKGVLSDIQQDLSTIARWQIPKARFEDGAAALLQNISQELRHRMGTVSSALWAQRCEALGLNEVGNLALSQKWVVAVGSLCEPDTAVLLRRLHRFTLEEIAQGNEAQMTCLALLDCGLPDHPDEVNQLWTACPASVIAQLLRSVDEYSRNRDTLTHFTASTGLKGLTFPAVFRQQTAVGVLRCYFLSTLLQPRQEPPAEWRRLTSESASEGLDRVSAYVEVALDLSNLPELIVWGVLAEWMRLLAGQDEVRGIEADLRAYVSGRGTRMDARLIGFCLREAAAQGTWTGLDALELSIAEDRNRAVESLENQTRLQSEPAPPPRKTFFEKLRLLFGRAAPASEPVSAPVIDFTGRIERSSQVLNCLESLRAVAKQMAQMVAESQDRKYAYHFEKNDGDPTTLVVRYRRIPRNNCPPALLGFIRDTAVRAPSMLIEILLSGMAPSGVLDTLFAGLKDIWSKARLDFADPDTEWQEFGIDAWFRADPGLAAASATFAYQRLGPLWSRVARTEKRWEGFLTVFDYGAGSELTREGFGAVSKALVAEHVKREAINRFGDEWPIRHVLESGPVNFESWPFLYSMGFLWTDYPVAGRGFSEDWDRSQFELQALRWRDANPDEAKLTGAKD
jgi:hypothetical protein